MQQIQTAADVAPSLQLREDHMTVQPRWDAQRWRAADPENAEMIAGKTKPAYDLPVTTVLINRQIAFLAMPGEPFVDFQIEWRALPGARLSLSRLYERILRIFSDYPRRYLGRLWRGSIIDLDRGRCGRADVESRLDTSVRDARTDEAESGGPPAMSPCEAISRRSGTAPGGGAGWFLSCLIVLMTLMAFPVSAATLRAGVAQVDITPPLGLPMYGYLDRLTNHQVAAGTLDPLYARVLIIEGGSKRLALVTLDLGRTFNESWLDRLRTTAQKTSHIEGLIVTASHTHSGPNILDQYPDGHLPAWQNAMLDKITDAIHQAVLHLEPVRLGTGYGVAQIGYNRRHVSPDSSITMLWSNPSKIPTAPVDATVSVIRIDRQEGTPIAILINYACHPVVFGADNLRYSADYVSTMLSTVAAAFAKKPICLFLQGADGDINPYYATTPVKQDAVEKRDWTGRELGMEAARVAKGIQTGPSSMTSLDFADDVIEFPLRWNPQKFHDDLLRKEGPLVFQDHAERLDVVPRPSELALHVITLLIDKQIGFVGMPGEPFVDFQINWRDRCPVRDCLLLGYTNGYFDYFPTILAASQGGYGAGDSNTYVAVGAGERMLDHALVRIYQMLGELSPVPASQNQTSRVR